MHLHIKFRWRNHEFYIKPIPQASFKFPLGFPCCPKEKSTLLHSVSMAYWAWAGRIHERFNKTTYNPLPRLLLDIFIRPYVI